MVKALNTEHLKVLRSMPGRCAGVGGVKRICQAHPLDRLLLDPVHLLWRGNTGRLEDRRQNVIHVAELAADAALERARLDAGRAGDRKLAEAIVGLLAAQAADGSARSEIASLMRTAGLSPDGYYLVAAMTAEKFGGGARIANRKVDRGRGQA